jgi:hypothetical protein
MATVPAMTSRSSVAAACEEGTSVSLAGLAALLAAADGVAASTQASSNAAWLAAATPPGTLVSDARSGPAVRWAQVLAQQHTRDQVDYEPGESDASRAAVTGPSGGMLVTMLGLPPPAASPPPPFGSGDAGDDDDGFAARQRGNTVALEAAAYGLSALASLLEMSNDVAADAREQLVAAVLQSAAGIGNRHALDLLRCVAAVGSPTVRTLLLAVVAPVVPLATQARLSSNDCTLSDYIGALRVIRDSDTSRVGDGEDSPARGHLPSYLIEELAVMPAVVPA